MEDSTLIQELLQLTLACERGEATEEERARLERLLADSPRAVELYVQIVEDTLTLCELSSAVMNGAPRELEDARCGEGELQRAESWFNLFQASGNWKWWLGAVTAACLALMATALAWNRAENRLATGVQAEQSKANLSARVVSATNMQWDEGAPQFGEWSYVEPGQFLKFESGVIDLFLDNGVELFIEGPADVQFVSLEKVVARQGNLAARVGPEAVGFRIETPHAEVIDRGTSFGLSVNKGECRTSVVVYEGIVDLDVLDGRQHPRRRLETGEALSVDRNGHLSRVTTVQDSEFLTPPRHRLAKLSQTPLIEAVSDNMRSLETAKYYRVIPGGFQEDCRAYVDRQHEWNGLDESGLPIPMLGGDYVMTFNDDKIATEIETSISLPQPCTLYVMVDDRVPPPEWLTREFVDTGWDIGSDEGYDGREIQTTQGAGKSIDHVCSVWRREVETPGTVVLGALTRETSEKPARDVERSMYGIVVTPIRN